MKSVYQLFCPLLRLAAPGQLAAAAAASLTAAICALGLMGAAAWLITSAALQPPLAALALGITIVRTCGIGRAVFRYADRWFSHQLAFHSHTQLQLKLYDQAAATLPLRTGMASQGLWLHQLTSSCQTLREFYLRALLPPIASLLLSLLASFVLFGTIGTVSLLLPLLWLSHLLLPCLLETPHGAAGGQAKAAYRSALLDAASGQAELLVAGSLPAVRSRLAALARQLRQEQQQGQHQTLYSDLLLQVLDALVLILLLASLTSAALSGILTFIELTVWLFLLLALQSEFQPLAAAARAFQESQQAAAPLFSVPVAATCPAPASAASSPLATAPLLAVSHLTFGYHEQMPILHDISFTVTAGAHTAILGDSGSGKTTLGCLLTACWPVPAGTIRLQGQDSTSLSPAQQREYFSAPLQGCDLPAGSIRSLFLRLIPGISDEAIWHSLQVAQLAAVIGKLPAGLDSPLTSSAGNLSGGERNRLLTALAIARPAPILLLDEPTAGLDEKTASALLTAVLDELDEKQRTLLIITHDPLAAARVQQVVRL